MVGLITIAALGNPSFTKYSPGFSSPEAVEENSWPIISPGLNSEGYNAAL
jgi:hypothetical protein